MNQPATLPPQPQETQPGEMGLFDHLRELRSRLLVSFVAVVACSIGAYFFSKELFELLNAPYYAAFSRNSLIGTGPAEAFMLKIKVSVFAGIIVAAPVIFHQIWLFVSPGLYDHEKRLAIPFLLCTTGLFALGIFFGYSVLFPFAFDFFREQYQSIELTPTIRLSEHLSMMVTGLLGFGAIFQMPVLAFFLARLGVIDDKLLISGTRYAIVIIFIIAAIITPPDVITQFLIAGPLLVLYGISILIVRFTCRAKASRNEGVPGTRETHLEDE